MILRPILFVLVVFIATVSAVTLSQSGELIELQPYKNRLFSYPGIIETRDGGAFVKVDYREARDIDRRDQVAERRVKNNYVSFKPRGQQRPLSLTSGAMQVEAMEVGRAADARFVVIFIHGRGGDKRLGINDWTFGGNFNRLKNLAVRNGGVYYTPTIPSFDATGLEHLSVLVNHLSHVAPDAPVILACGSMGSLLCWAGGNDARIAPRLGGIVVLGGSAGGSYRSSKAYQNRVPVLFAHGSNDTVYDWQDQHAFYRSIRNGSDGQYPIRFILFNGGTHGTPIRMIDWRDTINWMLAIAS
ncbi:MAG: phospholipase [Pseudomonadota bacterium]